MLMGKIIDERALQAAVSEMAKEIKNDRMKVGHEDGIAPLNTYGIVPSEHLPLPMLFISGTLSGSDQRILAQTQRLPYEEGANVELWRTMVSKNNRKTYPGFVVTADGGESFYSSWDWQFDSGIPASEELEVSFASFVYFIGNCMARRVGASYIPLLDLDPLLDAKAGISDDGVITANKFLVEGGSSSQFLKANGSLDDNRYFPVLNIAGKASGYIRFSLGNGMVTLSSLALHTTIHNYAGKVHVATLVYATQTEIYYKGASIYIKASDFTVYRLNAYGYSSFISANPLKPLSYEYITADELPSDATKIDLSKTMIGAMV